MSHNNVKMICTFGFVICFVPPESWYHCFLFYYIDWRRQQVQFYTFIFWLRLTDVFLARQALHEIFFMNYVPFSFIKPSRTITFFRGGSTKFRKKGQSPPLSPSNENFTSAWLYNYNNTRKTVRRVGVIQKRFENTRKKGDAAPSAPPLNLPMLLNEFLGLVG